MTGLDVRINHGPARVGVVVSLVAYATLLVVLLPVHRPTAGLGLAAAATVLFAVGVLALRRARWSGRRTAAVVVGSGAALQVAALTAPPSTSDDFYRYLWDAKVQLGGIDPYRYAPSAPQLAQLRDGYLFGSTSACTHPIAGGCTAINRPDVHTIYPPFAQLLFAAIRVLSWGGHGGALPLQVAAAAGVTAVTLVLVRRALARGDEVWPVAIWAWCPVVVIDLANNAHIDWLAALLGVLALVASARRRDGPAALLLAAAILTKLYPALLLPVVMKRRPGFTLMVTAASIAAAYALHVAAVGTAVIGYLPGYLNEEGYDSGSRLQLLGAVLPHAAALVIGVGVLIAAAVWTWRHVDVASPEAAATVFVGVAFLVATPAYGWYAALLVALIAMSRRYEWIFVAMAPMFVYLVRADITHRAAVSTLIYLLAGAATLAAAGWRNGWRPGRPDRSPLPAQRGAA